MVNIVTNVYAKSNCDALHLHIDKTLGFQKSDMN